MPSPSNCIPRQISLGDSVSWTRHLREYSSADWMLAYTVVAAAGAKNFEAIANDDGTFSVSLTPSDTSGFPLGRCTITEYVSQGSGAGAKRITLRTVPITVVPNAAGATGGVDMRSNARRLLDAIEQYMLNKSPTTERVIIDGLRIDKYPLQDLLKYRDKFKAEVAREEMAARGRRGSQILTRFSRR